MKHCKRIILDWISFPSDLLFVIKTPLHKIDMEIFEIWKVKRKWRYKYSTTRILEFILKYRFKKQLKKRQNGK